MSSTPSANSPSASANLVTLSGKWTVPVIQAAGSGRQIGLTTGQALRDEIKKNLELFPLLDLQSDAWKQRRDNLSDALFRHVPQVLEELAAMAEAADVSFDALLYLNTEPQYGLPPLPADGANKADRCTNIVFAAGPDGPIWGKNNDRPAIEAPRPVAVRVVHRTGKIPLIVFTYAGLLATADAMNAAGLTVGHSSVGSVFEQRDCDVPIRLWAYEGLMRCTSTEEFVDHMRCRPLRGKGYSMVCVDAEGKAVSLEAPCPLVQVRRPTNPRGHIQCVNLYQLPSLANADRRKPEGKELTAKRSDWLNAKLAESLRFDLADMQAVLSSREFPAICRNAEPPDTSVTEYSMIGLPSQRRAMFLYGQPGDVDYATLQFNPTKENAQPTPASSGNTTELDVKNLKAAMERACHWIQDIAQLPGDTLPADTENRQSFPYSHWQGAVRGEYSAAKKKWWFFCPVWHTGQAVKALVLASQTLGQTKWLDGARQGAEFIYHHQIFDEAGPDHGLILAYEDIADQVNTSAVMECMHGLMLLADVEKDQAAWRRIVAAGEFLLAKMFMPEEGLFRDVYDPATHSVVIPNPFRTKDNIGGRPLVEDAVFVRLYERTKDRKFLDAHLRVSQRLVADQRPPGNWIDYGPCSAEKGLFHPRHTYWWGLPLLDSYRATGDRRYLDTAVAAGEFCSRAMRRDGGYIRGTYFDFNTDSFGHATSGSATSAVLFLRLYQETKEDRWRQLAELALSFCMKVQFLHVSDKNLEGSILEKVLEPNHSDASPYHIRDLGTIFFLIAAAEYLKCM